MNHQRHRAIEMLPPISQEWAQAHPIKEHEHVSEEDRKGVPREQILEAFAFGRLQILLLGHDRKRSDMRPPELRIMLVMIIVGTAPDTAGRQRVNPKNSHEQLRRP